MISRETLMKRLQICDFVLTEVGLFLDTHPKDQDALAYYNKYLALKKEALAEYTKQYGTVDRNHLQSENKWDWVDEPWPWENSEG
jgi:spore coat protein JB